MSYEVQSELPPARHLQAPEQTSELDEHHDHGAYASEAGQMAASDYVPTFFKNRLHLAGRPQMSTRPHRPTPRLLKAVLCTNWGV